MISWTKKPKYKLFDVENEFTHVRICAGRFRGVEYKYGTVRPQEDKHGETLRLSFTYTITKGKVDERDTSAFVEVIGNILTELIEHG